jgi:hypothetical protein
MTPKDAVKNLIKSFLSRSTIKYSPLWGAMLTAYKQKDVCPSSHLKEMFISRTPSIKTCAPNIYTVWHAKQDIGKQVGLVYQQGPKDRSMAGVCKAISYPFGRYSSIEQENRILHLLSSHACYFQEHSIKIPAPLFLKTNGIWYLSGETPVAGTPLSELKQSLTKDRIKKTIARLFMVQLNIQRYLTEHLIDHLPALDAAYFANSIGVRHKHLDDAQRVIQYRTVVQHGDFTDVNLLYDCNKRSWGIIDWEWTSSGFPPFIDTFFRRNWFSQYIRELIDWYLIEIGVSRSHTYDLFMDFLIFLYNKYRLDYKLPEYEEMHKQMILYALEHRTSFSL